MPMIDKDAAIRIAKDFYCEGCACDAEYCLDAIRQLPTIPDINRAAILRLCNDIEESVSIIDKYETNGAIYCECENIMQHLKDIGKELTGDAESKVD